MGRIGVTWFGFYGSVFLCGIGICGQVVVSGVSGVSFRAAGWCGYSCGIRASVDVGSEMMR